jgi:hypothetical protein
MRPPSSYSPLRSLLLLGIIQAIHGTAAAADPTTGECLAAYEQSISLRTRHELNAARAALLTCAAPSCPEDVRNECAHRVEEVNAQLPSIVFEAKDRDDNDLSKVSVSMDGRELAPRLDGSALSVDPGEHEFVFSVEGSPPLQKSLVIREGEKGRREKVVLGPERAPLTAAPVPTAPAELMVEPAPAPAARPKEEAHTQRNVGMIVGGAGVVALGIALYQQVSAHNHYADSERAAHSIDPAVRANTHALYEQAVHGQTSAIFIGAVGLAALGSGIYLLLSKPDESAPRAAGAAQLAPWFAPGSGGARYARTF